MCTCHGVTGNFCSEAVYYNVLYEIIFNSIFLFQSISFIFRLLFTFQKVLLEEKRLPVQKGKVPNPKTSVLIYFSPLGVCLAGRSIWRKS